MNSDKSNQRSASFSPPVNMLVRLWIPGSGCRYFRSASMGDATARDIGVSLSEEDGIQVEDSESRVSELTVPTIGTRVFALHRKQRDPDNPQRQVTTVFVWVTDRAGMDLAEARGFFDEHMLPQSEKELLARGFRPVGVDFARSASNAHVESARERPATRIRWFPAAVIAVALLVVSAICYFVTREKPRDDPTNPAAPGTQQEPDPEWDMQGIKYEMRSRLRAAGQENVDNIDAENQLRSFVQLFIRPDVEKLLDQEQLASYRRFRETRLPHPFLGFFDQLLDELPPQDSQRESSSWPELADAYLRPLARELKESPMMHGVTHDDSPPELMKALRAVIDYEEFYDQWQVEHSRFPPTDPWYEIRYPGLMEWERPFRELLKERYTP